MNTNNNPSDNGAVNAQSAPLRIIIADDEAPARRRLFDLLDEMEATFPHRVVAEVENGKAALEAAQRGADVMLLDINMPLMDGLETARHLLKMDNAPRVIFVTAYDQHAVEAFEVHAVDYLMKPVRRERLIAALERAKPLTATRRAAILQRERARSPDSGTCR
jgi:two-component system, LytTR family, response regulator AlgR